MKLLTRTNLNFLSISLFIFLVGLITFYYLLRKQIDININAELSQRQATIISQISSANQDHTHTEQPENWVLIKPYNFTNNMEKTFKDTLIFNSSSNRLLPYRQLSFNAVVNNQKSQIQIYKSLGETDQLMIRILLMLTLITIALIISLLILNRHTTKKAWSGFYNTISQIKNYDINSNKDFSLKESDIQEFEELNKVIRSMTKRIKNDYYNLKEYTENASHEIQTPLAVINSKLELLLQADYLKEKELTITTDALEACSKLSRLNKVLLLLTKIENRQFPDTEQINLTSIINAQLTNFEEIIKDRKIKVTRPKLPIIMEMNPFLAEILISNLIKNAIRHNLKKGTIAFRISTNELIVSNSGEEIPENSEHLFKRFFKATDSTKSTGLGLAIVQKICDVSGFKIKHKFDQQMHHFIINFTF